MSLGLEFQRNKVNRLIQQKGIDFRFKRQNKNDYGEPINNSFTPIKIRGFYHESSSFVTKSIADSSVVRSKSQPMILVSYEDGKKLRKNDLLEFNGNNYEVVDIQNVDQLNVCCDVSLEVIQNG